MITSIFELDKQRKEWDKLVGEAGEQHHLMYICTNCNSYFYLYEKEQAFACCGGEEL